MIIDHCYGCFFGGVIGDTLGGPVEFKKRDSFPLVTDMNLYNYNLGLPEGSWTDDTSMTLCLAQSLIDKGILDSKDVLTKYSNWFRNGYMSVIDRCVDIGKGKGKGTVNSIIHFERTNNLISILDDPLRFSGNGSIMRMSPIPIFCIIQNKTVEDCMEMCVKSSETTHSSIICRDSSKLFGCILYNLIKGVDKDSLINIWRQQIDKKKLCKELHSIYSGDFLNKSRNDIKSTGYVIDTLEAALYSFFKFDNYHDTILFCVNLGDDSDTVGCVTGQIAGAYYGIRHIPRKWIWKLRKLELLWQVIDDLYNSFDLEGVKNLL